MVVGLLDYYKEGGGNAANEKVNGKMCAEQRFSLFLSLSIPTPITFGLESIEVAVFHVRDDVEGQSPPHLRGVRPLLLREIGQRLNVMRERDLHCVLQRINS